jgi:hypothetical protein
MSEAMASASPLALHDCRVRPMTRARTKPPASSAAKSAVSSSSDTKASEFELASTIALMRSGGRLAVLSVSCALAMHISGIVLPSSRSDSRPFLRSRAIVSTLTPSASARTSIGRPVPTV